MVIKMSIVRNSKSRTSGSRLPATEEEHLRVCSPSTRETYEKIKAMLLENGLGQRVVGNYIGFWINGRRRVKMFPRKDYFHVYVLHDDYKYFHDGDNGDRHAQLKSKVTSYQVMSPNKEHKHFYLVVNDADHIDELRTYIQPVLSSESVTAHAPSVEPSSVPAIKEAPAGQREELNLHNNKHFENLGYRDIEAGDKMKVYFRLHDENKTVLPHPISNLSKPHILSQLAPKDFWCEGRGNAQWNKSLWMDIADRLIQQAKKIGYFDGKEFEEAVANTNQMNFLHNLMALRIQGEGETVTYSIGHMLRAVVDAEKKHDHESAAQFKKTLEAHGIRYCSSVKDAGKVMNDVVQFANRNHALAQSMQKSPALRGCTDIKRILQRVQGAVVGDKSNLTAIQITLTAIPLSTIIQAR